MNERQVADNIRRLRGEKKLSQSKLAEAAGISPTALKNIELGKSQPRSGTLIDISSALGVSLDDLLLPVRQLQAVRFRAMKRLKSRDSILVEVAKRIDDFLEMENLTGQRLPFSKDLKKVSDKWAGKKDPNRTVQAATEARAAVRLSPYQPIGDICGILEDAGIKVFRISLETKVEKEEEDFFGLSVAESDGGPAVAVNVAPGISTERKIFSLVHELGHLLLHLHAYDVEQTREDKGQEKEANRFAGHFLMPQEAFEKEWGDTFGLPFMTRVFKTKRIFKVSYKTVLYRLVEMGEVDNSVWPMFKAEYKRVHHRPLGNKQEPLGLVEYDFIEERLQKLVRVGVEQGKLSLLAAARVLRLPLADFRREMSGWRMENG